MQVSILAKTGGRYFFCVFFWACLLGCIRVPFLVPLLGQRYAELIEMPLLLFVINRAAKAVPRSLMAVAPDVSVLDFAAVGTLAISIQLGAEWLNIKLMSGKTVAQFVKDRDEIGLYAFLLELAAFTALPVYEGSKLLRVLKDSNNNNNKATEHLKRRQFFST